MNLPHTEGWREEVIALWKKLNLPDTDSEVYSGAKYTILSLVGTILTSSRTEAYESGRLDVIEKIGEFILKNQTFGIITSMEILRFLKSLSDKQTKI